MVDSCPFCSGKLLITASQAGEEIYCIKCLRVLKSASLKFSYKSTDFAGEVSECSDGGLPGFKGSGKKAKCHVYQPGDDSGKTTAQQKAKQSAYTTMKKSHIENLIREGSQEFCGECGETARYHEIVNYPGNKHKFDPGSKKLEEVAKNFNSTKEAAFGGFDTTQVPEFATTNDKDHNDHFGPSGQVPDAAVGTQISEDGVWDNNLFNNINNNSASSAY